MKDRRKVSLLSRMSEVAFTRGCDGKRRYTSRRQAHGSRRIIARDYGDTRLHAYHCRICHKWHLGHRNQRKAAIEP